MTDIFLSYSSDDRDRVVPLVEALQADGFSVWWDRDIRPGPSFDREIEAALDKAGCVVVVWSQHSVESEWVRSEVDEGSRLGILVPLMIDDILPPLAYRRRQAAHLAQWTGDRDHPEYQKLLFGIAATLEQSGGEVPNAHRERRTGTLGAASGATRPRAPRWGNWMKSAATAVAFIVLGWLLSAFWSRQASDRVNSLPGSLKRAEIALPEGKTLALANLAPLGAGRRSLEFSPDGRYLALVVDIGGQSQLYLRAMDELEARPLAGTEGAFAPFFSPDGQWLAYLTRTHVMKMAVPGGTPQTLVEAANVYGAHWGDGNRIIFADREGSALIVIGADGGNRTELPNPEGKWLTHPFFLPGGEAVLASSETGNGRRKVEAFDFETGEWQVVVDNGTAPRLAPSGHLLYSGIDAVMAAPFDQRNLALSGPATTVLTGVRHEATGEPQLALSSDGWLAYLPGPDTRVARPVWRERNGDREIPLALPENQYGTFSLSPDERYLAFLVMGLTRDLWVYDFDQETPPNRFTTGGNKTAPIWSIDGQRLAFAMGPSSGESSAWGVYSQALNGSQMVQLLPIETRFVNLSDWGQDDNIFFTHRPGSNEDVLYFNDREAEVTHPLADSPATEWGPSRSPDGHFVAYTSDETGEYQIHVKRFPPSDERWVISAGYGEEPIWSHRGDEIFYRRGHQWLSVPVKTQPEFEAGIPAVLFEGSYLNVPGRSYDVSNDAQRFLVLKMPDQPTADRVQLVSNWLRILERPTPASP